jgi:hypothetical protein
MANSALIHFHVRIETHLIACVLQQLGLVSVIFNASHYNGRISQLISAMEFKRKHEMCIKISIFYV